MRGQKNYLCARKNYQYYSLVDCLESMLEKDNKDYVLVIS